MTFAAPDSATTNTMRIPSIVVLGADALLAALPATPIQLAHACALAGYQHVVPASWGDELIALASLRALRDHAHVPAIQCSCPYVAHRLLAVGTDLRPFLVSLVAPPVVLARYLRAAYAPRKLRITYVGRCPGAGDEAIDARLTPEELLAIFSDHHIVIEDQPEAFDSVLPPDRRRYRSQPGGLPTPEMLWSAEAAGVARSVVELCGDELPVELAQHLLSGKPVLIDVAPKLGCVCSGAVADASPFDARARVTALEPPRATSPVIDETIATETILPLPASPRSAIDIVSPPASAAVPSTSTTVSPNDSSPSEPEDESPGVRSTWAEPTTPVLPSSPARRHSPSRGIARPVAGVLPTARDIDGRQLPRTYVARRRVPSRGSRTTPAEAQAAIPAQRETAPTAPSVPAPNESPPNIVPARSSAVVGAESPREAATPTAPSSAFLPPHAATLASSGGESVDTAGGPRGATAHTGNHDADVDGRFAERAVALPVTRLSDHRPREEPTPAPAGDRPVMQILTLGLLIAMVVLVSAAVGVLVGRWMSQR